MGVKTWCYCVAWLLCFVDQAGLELTENLLFMPPECWDSLLLFSLRKIVDNLKTLGKQGVKMINQKLVLFCF